MPKPDAFDTVQLAWTSELDVHCLHIQTYSNIFKHIRAGPESEVGTMLAAMQVMPQMKTVMKQDWSANTICIVKMSDFAGDLGVTDLLSKEQLDEKIVFKMCKGMDENDNDVYEVKASIAHILKALGKYFHLQHAHRAIMEAWDHVKNKTPLGRLSDGASACVLAGTKSPYLTSKMES